MTHMLWSTVPVLFAMAIGIAWLAACANQSEETFVVQDQEMPQERSFVSVPGYEESGDLSTSRLGGGGFMSLDERISRFDVIIKGQLQGNVSSVAARDDILGGDELHHVVWLEFTFNVLEYLKGTGDAQVTAVVPVSHVYDSAAEAQAATVAAQALHDTRWDDREAILFLNDDLPSRYGSKLRLGWTGPTNLDVDDTYSIYACCVRRWLPSAASSSSEARGESGASDNQTFYLWSPEEVAEIAASGLTPTEIAELTASNAPWRSGQSTITLASLKARIASIEQEIADGGGSEEYRRCIATKYLNIRSTESVKASNDGQYYYARHDESLDSGQAAGTVAYRGSYALSVGDDATRPSGPYSSDYRVLDNDAHLFTARWPGVVSTARPLPMGSYRFFFGKIPKSEVICEAATPEQLRRHEVFVTVTAPEGTVHEAFFDPQTIGPGDGYISSDQRTAGELSPATFTTGNTTTTISSLFATENAVTMVLTTPLSLPDHSLDFIALNGSVPLSLDWGAATTSGSTLTWSVAKQPWSSGNELMLRLRRGSPITTPTPATTPMPTPTPIPSRR